MYSRTYSKERATRMNSTTSPMMKWWKSGWAIIPTWRRWCKSGTRHGNKISKWRYPAAWRKCHSGKTILTKIRILIAWRRLSSSLRRARSKRPSCAWKLKSRRIRTTEKLGDSWDSYSRRTTWTSTLLLPLEQHMKLTHTTWIAFFGSESVALMKPT